MPANAGAEPDVPYTRWSPAALPVPPITMKNGVWPAPERETSGTALPEPAGMPPTFCHGGRAKRTLRPPPVAESPEPMLLSFHAASGTFPRTDFLVTGSFVLLQYADGFVVSRYCVPSTHVAYCADPRPLRETIVRVVAGMS